MPWHFRFMSRDERIGFHSARAAEELDRALHAGSYEAARAHFSLSSLHLETSRDLAARAGAKPRG